MLKYLYLLVIYITLQTPLHAEVGNSYYLVAIPPDIPKDKVNEFHANFTNFLYKLNENDYVEIINSKNANKVDDVKIPKGISSSVFGKKRFFKRKLKNYLKYLGRSKSNSMEVFNTINLRKIIRYAKDVKTINSNIYSSYKFIIYGNPFPKVPHNSNDTFFKFDLKSLQDIHKSSNDNYFGTIDKKPSLDGFNVFMYTSDDLTSYQKNNSERFMTTYICSQGGVLNIFTNNTASMNVISSEKSTLLKSRYSCHNFNQQTVAIEKTKKQAIKTEEIFKQPIFKNPPPPTSNLGYMKIGLRWNYDSCIKRQHDCDLDLIIKPNKFEPEVFYKNRESTTYGWYKKLDPENGNNSYEVVDLARAPVKIDDVVVYVNFFSGSAPNGIDAELRVVFDDKIYYKEFHIRATKGNKGKGARIDSVNWIKLDMKDLLKPTIKKVKSKAPHLTSSSKGLF